MKFYSTNNAAPCVDARQAVMGGLAPDGGLYMPGEIPKLSRRFLSGYHKLSFQEIAYETARPYFEGVVPDVVLQNIVQEAYDFEVPLVNIDHEVLSYELYHGPTLAFKDFAARFMARLMGYFVEQSGEQLTILVATSGDTGGAVGNGFLGVPGIDVVILYPSGMVSRIQEQQLTTMGQNVQAIEVEGTFDDCQRMVKKAFVDRELQERRPLGSANSINIARLIPQAFYYVFLAAQIRKYEKPNIISVPSGNFGNLTAGLIAQRMGAHLDRFVASTNVNDSVPRYLNSGLYEPKPSVATISNAMDVGDPSNFVRMDALFHHAVSEFRAALEGYRYTDEETRKAIKEVYEKYAYVMDPHGAVGWLGLQTALSQHPDHLGVFVETAHPAKFKETVDDTLDIDVEIPRRLAKHLDLQKQAIKMRKEYGALREWLSV